MAIHRYQRWVFGIALGLVALTQAGCGPRVLISTGTTIGLKATPGDGTTRPPQVTLGYKRAEAAIVPTKGVKATSTTDAFSTLAAIYFNTSWFGTTEIRSFVSTGVAARDIQGAEEDNTMSAMEERGKRESKSTFWKQFESDAESPK